MAQYSTNQYRARQSVELAVYIVIPRVRKAEQRTEIQNRILKTLQLGAVIVNAHTQTHTLFVNRSVARRVDKNSLKLSDILMRNFSFNL